MSSAPRVSVIIPNYNHAPYLEKRIRSVLEQTYQDFEVLLLDDCSTDDSLEVIARYENNPKVQIHLNKENGKSPFKQWNKGVGLARGEYIWIAESDDWADPRLLEVLVDLLDQHPSVGIAYCQSHAIDSGGQVTGSLLDHNRIITTGEWEHDFVKNGRELCRHFLRINIIPNASAVVFRKAVYLQIGKAPEDMRLAGDLLTWAQMLSISDLAYVTEHLNYHRHHEITSRVTYSATPVYIEELVRVIRWLKENVELPSDDLRGAVSFLCRWWRKSAHKRIDIFPLRSNIHLTLLVRKLTQQAFRTFFRIELYRIRDKMATIRHRLPWSAN